MALRLTKTNKIIFAIVIVVLSGALGYLIWRVNQPDTVAPGDADAGGGGDGGGCCLPVLVNGVLACPYGEGSYACENDRPCCGATQILRCGEDTFCTGEGFLGYPNDCDECTESDLPPEQDCHTGSDCEACRFPNVGFCISGDCRCLPWDSDVQVPCTDGSDFSCDAKCPTGTIECSSQEEGCEPSRENCTCPVCNNKTYDITYCKPVETRPDLCDHTTITRSTLSDTQTATMTSYTNGPSVNIFSFAFYNTDNPYPAGDPKPICIPGTPSYPDTQCPSGSKPLILADSNMTTMRTSGSVTFKGSDVFVADMNWGGKKVENIKISAYFQATGGQLSIPDDACQENIAYSPTVVIYSPAWDISKRVVESCLEEGTENPVAQLTYTITVSNTGDGAGSISRIEDVLDSKVLAGFVQPGITTPGVFTSGKIVWDYSDPNLSIAAGTTRTYTYTLNIDKDSFGAYNNTVTVTPVGSSPLSATASIDADCEILVPEEPEEPVTPEEPEEPVTPEEPEEPVTPEESIPQTGIFDSTVGRVSVGLILVILGGIVYNMPNGMFRVQFKENSYKYRERFEKKVAKK